MSNFDEKKIFEQLTLMGYSAPNWDNYHINKPTSINLPPSLSTTNTKPVEISKEQLFIIKCWPKIVGFYHEDEDTTVTANAQTVRKNGQMTRIFRMGFDNEQSSQRWQIVFEKRIDAGPEIANEDDIRQIWTKCSQDESIPVMEEKFLYSHSFDTQASSSKFKSNSEDGVVSNFQKSFLREIKTSLAEAYQNSDSFAHQVVDIKEQKPEEYFKGKELQFESEGTHITWGMSMRPISSSDLLISNTWFVNMESTETSTPQEQGIVSAFEQCEGNEEKNTVEQEEIERQMVEQKIREFIGDLWPKVRNFYLELPDSEISFATATARKNGFPTRMVELHFDTLNERNRWKFLFEISVASNDIPSRVWAQLDPNTTDSYFEARTYSSYEKRGTSSRHGEDKNDYFTGFYKRWFLNELQWKLVKMFAQAGYSLIDPKTFDPYLYKYGKDLEFASQGDQITWSFSVQKVAKYLESEAPDNVWCYCCSDNFITAQTQHSDSVSDDELGHVEVTRVDVGSKGRGPTKSKSRIRTLARNIVKPVVQKTSWLHRTSGIFRNKKWDVKDAKSKDNHSEQQLKSLDSKTEEMPLTEPSKV